MKLKLKNLCNDIVFLWQFSLDDFKSKYAGSAACAAWAILQPLSTIILYWFVFQIGFKSQPVTSVPFVLWLVAGLLPWLFFSEAIANATSALAYSVCGFGVKSAAPAVSGAHSCNSKAITSNTLIRVRFIFRSLPFFCAQTVKKGRSTAWIVVHTVLRP